RALMRYIKAHMQFGSRGIFASHKPESKDRMDRLAYMLKAMDPRAFRYVGLEPQLLTEAFGLTRYAEQNDQGIIAIPRCGMSRNLASAARRRDGWREMRDATALSRALEEPYFAMLQLHRPVRPADPSLSSGEQIRARYSDPGYIHLRRMEWM